VTSAVLNASPFIVLARAGYLDLLPKLVTGVLIPRAVVTEVLAGPATDAAAEFLRKPSSRDSAHTIHVSGSIGKNSG
jgi:hypothetical protein